MQIVLFSLNSHNFVCTYLIAFYTAIPNKVSKFQNVDIFYNFFLHFGHVVCSWPPQWKLISQLHRVLQMTWMWNIFKICFYFPLIKNFNPYFAFTMLLLSHNFKGYFTNHSSNTEHVCTYCIFYSDSKYSHQIPECWHFW